MPAGQKYVFRPYNYGPMSRDIYSDLDVVVAVGAARAGVAELYQPA